MIFYRNYHRKLQNKQEEVEAIRQCNGRTDSSSQEFELIELVLKKNCVSAEKRHGFQDTDIVHEQDGAVSIKHREAGSGTLRFEPNNYGNPVGFLAKTAHNMDMLAKSYHTHEWTFRDKAIEDEVKELHSKHWKSMSDKDKKIVNLMEEQKRQDRFSVAPDPEPVQPIKQDSTNKVLLEMSEMRSKLEKLEAENAELKKNSGRPISGVTPPSAESISGPVAPNPLKTQADLEAAFVENNSWVITAKDGTIYDFDKIPLFEIRKLARKYNVAFEKDWTKDRLIPEVIKAIEKESEETVTT